MSNKLAQTQVPIHELIARRWSGRAFDAQKTLPRTQLLALLEAARWAPSCFGDEPWRYIVWDRGRDQAAWQKAFDCLAEGNQIWVRNAPVLMLSSADASFRNGKPNRWGQHDTGAASENLCLQAASLGLMAHQMGGFDVEKIRHAFAIPERYMPMAMIAVGYPGPVSVLENEKYREMESAPRRRQPLEQCFFEAAWEKPLAT